MALRTSDASTITEIDQLGDAIAELASHLGAATARLLDLIREFDIRGGWNHGFRSCAAWLTWRIGLAPGAAREHVRVARALGTLPQLAEALARGELSYSKIRELTRVATPESEELLLAVGRAGTAEHVERIVRGWRRMDRKAEAREAALQHAARSLHVYPDEDGTVRIRGRLSPEAGALLTKSLAAARETLYQRRREQSPEADPPTMEQQQADALVLVAEVALHHDLDPGASGERYQVVVHVDAEVLATPDARVSASSKTVYAFQLERRSVWRAMRVESSCATTPTGASWRSVPGRARSRRRYEERCIIATEAAPSRAVACASGRVITSGTGLTAGPRPSRISRCSVAATIVRCTKKDSRLIDSRMASCDSTGLTVGYYRRYRRLPWCPGTPCPHSGSSMRLPAYGWMRKRRHRAGWESP